MTEDSLDNIPQELYWIDRAADLLDSKYRIPGTNIRFGADFILGLIYKL